MPLLVSLTRKRVIYLALELDRSWTDLPWHRLLGSFNKTCQLPNFRRQDAAGLLPICPKWADTTLMGRGHCLAQTSNQTANVFEVVPWEGRDVD